MTVVSRNSPDPVMVNAAASLCAIGNSLAALLGFMVAASEKGRVFPHSIQVRGCYY